MIYFPFCIHNHQPVGNFEHVMEESFQNSYWPFLKALAEHPGIKLSLHNSGYLLDWISENHPEYIELAREMVSRGQVEVIGGGYYEPVIPVIHARDRVGQIAMMADKLEGFFGARPRGMWLAERVWEPELPSLIKTTGLEFLVVDDYHFIKSGLSKEDLGGYYITEDQGNVLKIFPGSEALRYLIPFKPAEHLKGHFKDLEGFLRRGNAAIYGDDGEKFGVWPGTKKWVFDDGWLESFFRMIEECSGEGLVKSVTLSEYMDENEPVGRVYLPTTSYMEMGEWTLPSEASREFSEVVEDLKHRPDGDKIRRFVQGGTWRNFFSKYPESNWMHKRMLMISREVGERKDTPGEARTLLYKAQCNDAYWHGVFGGLYMPHLRTTVYSNLIRAEQALGLARPDKGFSAETFDMDADGRPEVVLRTGELNLFLSPRRGGSLVELDCAPKGVNLLNTLARWPEGYHHRLHGEHTVASTDPGEAKSIHEVVLVKEEGLEEYLHTDHYERTSFREHFFADPDLDLLYRGAQEELGNFHDSTFSFELKDSGVVMTRKGEVRGAEAEVKKTVRPGGRASFSVEYKVSGEGLDEGVFFAVEANVLLPCCDGPACGYSLGPTELEDGQRSLGTRGVTDGVKSVRLADTQTGVAAGVESEEPFKLIRFPVHTVSLSEGGFEKIFQGSCLYLAFPCRASGMEVSLKVDVEALD